jgi:hypothetical protein
MFIYIILHILQYCLWFFMGGDLVSAINGGTETEGIWEQGAEVKRDEDVMESQGED